MLDQITPLILTYNEAPNIARSLGALSWAQDIVVVDSFSDDNTVEIAKSLLGYSRATGDWFALVAPIGIMLGRIGCLLHGCCLGAACEPAWWTLRDASGIERWPAVPLEIGFNALALLAFLTLRKRRLLAGQHFHLYLMSYGAFRFAHEFVRATPRVSHGFTGYQFAALAVFALGLAGFIRRRGVAVKNEPALHAGRRADSRGI